MKIPFYQLNLEVDKLYLKPIDLTDEARVHEHLNFIEQFIVASGWSVEDYLRELFGFNQAGKTN